MLLGRAAAEVVRQAKDSARPASADAAHKGKT
jgi:hypothetical protein